MLQSLAIAILVSSSTMLTACAASAPTGWTTGGQPLATPQARWVNGDILVDVGRDGRVLVNGGLLFTIDASGRVYDTSNQPVALLQRDGMVLGTGDTPMGWVGAGEAILPGDEHSWLVLQPDGLLVQSDGEGQRAFGQWLGCHHPAVVQTCTLVSHIVGRELKSKQGDGDGFGLSPRMTLGVGTFITP